MSFYWETVDNSNIHSLQYGDCLMGTNFTYSIKYHDNPEFEEYNAQRFGIFVGFSAITDEKYSIYNIQSLFKDGSSGSIVYDAGSSGEADVKVRRTYSDRSVLWENVDDSYTSINNKIQFGDIIQLFQSEARNEYIVTTRTKGIVTSSGPYQSIEDIIIFSFEKGRYQKAVIKTATNNKYFLQKCV